MTRRENLPCSCACSQCHGHQFDAPPTKRPDPHRTRTRRGPSTADSCCGRTLFHKMAALRRVQGLKLTFLALLAVLTFVGSTQGEALDRQKRQTPSGACTRTDGTLDAIIDYGISEDTPSGTLIGVLPIDGVTGPGGDIVLTLTQGHQSIAFNSLTKEIILIQAVDADAEPPIGTRRISLIFQCQSTTTWTYFIEIKVVDVNDNAPQFFEAPYTTYISEALPINGIVFDGIKANDSDGVNINGVITYSILYYAGDPTSNATFAIPNTGKPEVRLVRKLDFEQKQQWIVMIEAKDNPLGNNSKSSTTTLTVNVLDSDDLPPFFIGCNLSICTDVTYTTTIQEKTARLSPLQFSPNQIMVVNNSGGTVDPQEVTFSFTGGRPPNYSAFFSINSITGDVTLLQPVRHSEFDNFVIDVEATKGTRSGNATVIIEITPINNFPLSFPASRLVGFISENAVQGMQVTSERNGNTPLLIRATDQDLDLDEDAVVTYLLNDDSGQFTFTQTGTNGVYLAYSGPSSGPLDAETQSNLTLSIIAMYANTSGQYNEFQPYAQLTVEVQVEDVDDNLPEFVPNQYFDNQTNQYNVNLKDNAALNTEVITIGVIDNDVTSASPDVTHTFLTQAASPLFSVVTQGGNVVIRLISEVTLNVGNVYIISLQLLDPQNQNRRSPPRLVYIRIISGVLNSPPVFNQMFSSTNADENLPYNALVYTVIATDPDGESLVYTITSGNDNNAFMITSNGEIRVQGSLDREVQSSYLLVIEASDGNLTASTQVLITINDVNDMRPVFITDDTFLIVEGISNELVGQVQAVDGDLQGTPNSIISYSFVPASSQFRIEANTGRIFTLIALDREQQDVYFLTVVATDSGANPLSETLPITILVQDTNDNRPIFEPAEFIVEVPEETTLQGFFAVQALDRDTDAPLRYAITVGNTSIFSIDAVTGNLSLLIPLDFESAPRSYFIEVTVTDVDINGQNLTDAANITVYVMDVNDNVPMFERPRYDIIALREYQIGDIVLANITVTDGDLANTSNSELTFRFEPPSDLFAFLDPHQGNVYVIGDISNTSMWHNLTIVVTDGGDPANVAAVPLSIVLRVEKPIFPENVIIVDDVMEGEEPGVVVAVIEAQANVGDVVLYDMVDATDPSAFAINTTDNIATIYTAIMLDREEVGNYSITVQASIEGSTPVADDGDGNVIPAEIGGRKKRQADVFSGVAAPTDPDILYIYVNVGDVNDNGPYFLQDNYYVGVSTVARSGTDVIRIEAHDDDEGENSVSIYSVVAFVQGEPLFRIDRGTGLISTTQSLEGVEAGSQFEYTVIAEDPNVNFTMAETNLKISLIDNSLRAILAGNIDPDVMRENQDILAEVLSEFLNADVYIEDVSQREVGNGLDPTGSDVLFYALDMNGDPIPGIDMVEILLSQNTSLNERYASIMMNKTITDIRRPDQPTTGPGVSPGGNGPTVEAVALICLACVLFVCVVIAIGVVIISWKKREIEKEKAGRMYLPAMYNTFNPYGNGDDLEMAQCPDKAFLPSTSNPVYYDDQSVQARGDDMFPNGTPSFLANDELDGQFDGETQERTLEFGPEDEEATAVANSILAGTSTMPEDSLMRGMTATLPGSADLESPSYSDQGTLPAYSRTDEIPSSFYTPGAGYTNHALSVDDDPDLKRELSSSPYQTKTNPLIGRDEDHSYTYSEASTPSIPSKSTSPSGTFDPRKPYPSSLADSQTNDNIHLLRMGRPDSTPSSRPGSRPGSGPGSIDSGHQSLDRAAKRSSASSTPIKVPPPVVPREFTDDVSKPPFANIPPNSDEENTSEKIRNESPEDNSNPPIAPSEVSSYTYTNSPSSTPPNPRRAAPILNSYDVNPRDIDVGLSGTSGLLENDLSSEQWETNDVLTTIL